MNSVECIICGNAIIIQPQEQFENILVQISLYVTDMLWMQHLQVMDYTRQSVNLRAYAQRDPLVEYKKEGLRLYQEMGTTFTNKVAELMAHVEVKQQREQEVKDATLNSTPDFDPDSVKIIKKGEQRVIKKKKLQTYLDAGWAVVS